MRPQRGERPKNGDRTVFIILVGGQGNIGEALIRRHALEWVRGLGGIEAYVGNAPRHWLEQIGLTDDDRAYSARTAWKWVFRLMTTQRPKALVFDPGEVLLAARRAPKEFAFLAMTVLAKASGARTVRMPRTVRNPARLTTALHRLACRASDVTLWRDERSHRLMRTGRLVPDIGFSEPTRAGVRWSERQLLTISLRARRPWPAEAWFDAVRRFADEDGLVVMVMSQVREDEVRTLRLAEGFGFDSVVWGSRTDSEQEDEVRGVYERSAYVISECMHVLVLAALSGAMPLEVVTAPKPKIREHFQVIGIDGITLDDTGLDSLKIVRFLRSVTNLQKDVAARIVEAQQTLGYERERVRSAISERRAAVPSG